MPLGNSNFQNFNTGLTIYFRDFKISPLFLDYEHVSTLILVHSTLYLILLLPNYNFAVAFFIVSLGIGRLKFTAGSSLIYLISLITEKIFNTCLGRVIRNFLI